MAECDSNVDPVSSLVHSGCEGYRDVLFNAIYSTHSTQSSVIVFSLANEAMYQLPSSVEENGTKCTEYCLNCIVKFLDLHGLQMVDCICEYMGPWNILVQCMCSGMACLLHWR